MPVEVTIGRQSVSRVVIDKGITAGDVVALRDPTVRQAGAVRRRGAGRTGPMMDVRESLGAGLESLRHHALRSFLAMLGIIFGVGAVIAMLSIGAGAEREALEVIDAMGLRNVVVKDKRFDRENELSEIRRKSAGLSPRDAVAIARRGAGRRARGREDRGRALEGARRRPAGRSRACSASRPSTPSSSSCACARAASSTAHDEETYAAVCVIGDEVRRDAVRLRAGARPARSRSTSSG